MSIIKPNMNLVGRFLNYILITNFDALIIIYS